jgi:hypothetical protein
MSLDADFQGHIEKDGVDFVVVIFGELDPVLALLRGKVRGVNVIHGTLGDEARFEHGTQVGENEILKALLTDIVEEQRTNHVARERSYAVTLEPGTLAGTGQADGEDHDAFGRALRDGGGSRRPGHRGRSGGCGLRGVFSFRGKRGCDSFGSEGLRDGLFAATASTSTASTTTAAATGAWRGFAGCGRVDGVRDLVGNVSRGSVSGRGVDRRSIGGRSGSRANRTRAGTWPGFRLRLRLVGGGRSGFPTAFFLCVGIGGQLFGVEICGLQRWRSRLVRRLGRLFLTALKTIAHPFTHVRLVTHIPRLGQWFGVVSLNS